MRDRLGGVFDRWIMRARRWWWARRYRLEGSRRALFERFGSARYSRVAIHGLDRMLERHLPRRPGTFVEAGAYDGVFQSNTYYLERFWGWSGVLIEPLPERS